MQNDAPPGEERQPSMERRLATIMMADVAGYSRMMGENEERTVQTLRGHREIFDALLGLHRGRIFNTAGDSVLAEFPSAVQAVRCATEIQAALRTRNEHLPEEQRMWFRIGINLGDVIVQGGDLLGDGVNVAARIQTIAEPGGICISGSVYDQIQNKLTLQFKLMGERSFKNIAQLIRTFSISEADGTAMPVASAPERPKGRKLVGMVAALLVLIVAAGGGYWIFRDYEARRAEEVRQVVETQRQAAESQRQAEEVQRQAAEEQRKAAEAQQRQAKLEAEAQTAKEALERAEAEKKRLGQELKRVVTEKRATEPTAPETAAGKAPPKAGEPQRIVPPAKDLKALDRFDGNYEGRLCSDRPGPLTGKRCWPAALKVEHGALLASWTHAATGKTGYAKGTISADGAVSITLEGWLPNGMPVNGSMTGKWDSNMINASGAWKSGLPVSGDWKRPF
jgi:class 3 adenylate cyclase